MELSLSTTQAELLRELLDSALRDLRMEISDTDNASYKHGLRDREVAIRQILEPLGGPMPDAPR